MTCLSDASYAPTGLGLTLVFFPRLAPWAIVFRRYAAFKTMQNADGVVLV